MTSSTGTNQPTAQAPERTETDFRAIARVASGIDLEDIRLQAAGVNLSLDPEEIPERWAGDAFVGYHTEVQPRQEDTGLIRLNAEFACLFKRSWSEQAFNDIPAIDEDDPPEVDIHASFVLTYRPKASAVFSDKDLAVFAPTNGTLHAWPYWRELAENAAQRMGLPRLVIGVFKVASDYDPPGEPADSAAQAQPDET